jgi:hypothetical protein
MDWRFWLFFVISFGSGIILWEIGAKREKKENRAEK